MSCPSSGSSKPTSTLQATAHGNSGPIPIRRVDRENWTALARGAHEYAKLQQLPFIADMNADFRDGYCSLPMSNSTTRRASAAMCYLDAGTRQRANLTVPTSANVSHLLFDGRRVTGVRAVVDGEKRDFPAREVILCGGGIFSPALLMRSGIGPAGPSARAWASNFAPICAASAAT